MKNSIRNRNVIVVASALFCFAIQLKVFADALLGFPPELTTASNSEPKLNNIDFEIINESKWAHVETAKVRPEGDSTLLYLILDLTRGSRFPFGYHVHVEIYDHGGKLTESFEQRIPHKHHMSRYLGHLHRAVFTPEEIKTNSTVIGKIKIVSHVGD